MWPDAKDDEANTAWVRDYYDATAPHSEEGGYINFMAEDDQDRIRANYKGNYDRLAEIKRPLRPRQPVPSQPEHRAQENLPRLLRLGTGVSPSLTRRATVWLTVAVAVQLVLSPRFFFKYVDPLPGAAYAVYVALGLLAWTLVVRSRACSSGCSARAACSAAGWPCSPRWSPSPTPRTPCARCGAGPTRTTACGTLVDNVVALGRRTGWATSGPCSTGPGGAVPFLPVAVWGDWFVVVPALVVLLGYRVWPCSRTRARRSSCP